jgi:hypothetical protein
MASRTPGASSCQKCVTSARSAGSRPPSLCTHSAHFDCAEASWKCPGGAETCGPWPVSPASQPACSAWCCGGSVSEVSGLCSELLQEPRSGSIPAASTRLRSPLRFELRPGEPVPGSRGFRAKRVLPRRSRKTEPGHDATLGRRQTVAENEACHGVVVRRSRATQAGTRFVRLSRGIASLRRTVLATA